VEEGTRALRNVDKLLADAHKSGLVSVREFIEYVRTLRDVGAREGEAPTEAGSAVQLMTVHKAKGLEFPIVVIADAAHSGHGGTSLVRLDDSLGVTVDLRDEDGRHPAAHLLAALRDAERDEAENRRLLYVAATRAQEKLLVSAHAKSSRDGTLSLSGWLKLLGQVVGLDQVAVPGDQVAVPGTPIEAQSLPLAADIGCVLYPWYEGGQETQGDAQCGTEGRGDPAPTLRVSRDLVAPLVPSPPATSAVPPEVSADVKPRARAAQPPRHVWRVVPQTKSPRAPAWVVGSLTHVALRHWHFVDDGFETFLRPFAIEMGIVDEGQIHAAVQEAARMLRRFRVHPLWTVLDTAQRWHKVAFSISENDDPVDGIIDLLYRVGENWNIAEFKSDRLPPDVDLRTHIREKAYDVQMQRYVRAVGSQLGVAVNAVFVFLNVGNKVSIVPAW
jgi:ATP-dependent exoDNAse (exonuclease V) beta subunit